MQQVSTFLTSSLLMITTCFAMDITRNDEPSSDAQKLRSHGVPQIIRTGTVHGEANGVAAPGVLNDLINGQIPVISKGEIKRLARIKTQTAVDLFHSHYNPALRYFLEPDFFKALPPLVLNSIGFREEDNNLTLSHRYQKLAFAIRDYLPNENSRKAGLIASAFIRAGDKMKKAAQSISLNEQSLKVDEKEALVALKIDLLVSSGQLLSWAMHQDPRLTMLRSAITKSAAEAASLYPYASTATKSKYNPLINAWVSQLDSKDKQEFIKTLAIHLKTAKTLQQQMDRTT